LISPGRVISKANQRALLCTEEILTSEIESLGILSGCLC